MKTIRIIHTNDIHSRFDKMTRMATLIRSLTNEHTLLLDAGDYNDFSSMDTLGSQGYVGLKLLHLLHYSALTIGNNEGFQELSTIQEMADYHLVDLLSCNLLTAEKKVIPGVKKSVIINIEKIRFLVIGVSPFHESYNVYYHMHHLHAISPYRPIQEEMEKYQGRYDLVLLLSHLGLKSDILLTQVIKGIDIIIGGHSHLVIPPIKVNETIITQAGVRGSHVGCLNLQIENNKIHHFEGEIIPINEQVKEDEQLKKAYEALKADALKQLSVPLFKIPQDLHYQIEQESELTNLLADYLKDHYDGIFAFIHGGLTEANLKAGIITRKDIMDVCCGSPLQIVTMDVQGKYLLEALKLAADPEKCKDSWRRPGFRGKFLGKIHVSYNCKIVETNDHVIQFFIEGHSCLPEKNYRIVTTDYFLRGMGYEILKNNQNQKWYKEQLYDALLAALKEKKAYEKIQVKRWVKEDD